jgi:predicted nuclease of restriction endonuclease-like RecB superfamily
VLPSSLLISRVSGEELTPQRLELSRANLELASELIALFKACRGGRRGDLDEQLQALEGEGTDYRVKRGLAHLLASSFSTFETVSPLEPPKLREAVFKLAAASVPDPQGAAAVVQRAADALTQELGRSVHPEEVREGLYADLPDNQRLVAFEPPTPETLLHRYNLAQAQGVLYRAKHVVITAHRNDPGEYKLLFRYLKLFGLMSYIEGDAEHGFTITVDGPASLFTPSTRYGLALAKLLPALLHVTRWSLVAELAPRPHGDGVTAPSRFTLDASCGLVSHYPPGRPYDSILESAFAERWRKAGSAWRLEREVELVSLPGSVMVPDFRLVHPDGRAFLLEIIGYWRPEYLKKKFAQVRRALRDDLILAVSEKLNLGRAGITLEDLPAKVVWFKEKLVPKSVLALLS